MQILLSFLIGYFVGAKAGEAQFDDVVESAKAVVESEEMRSFLMSLRSHAAATLHRAGDLLAESDGSGPVANDGTTDGVARVRRLMEQAKTIAPTVLR
jgi:hypothetical protein